ncbi:uncharacterized protein LOC112567516 [Pomacea canaliculata]|uniref:uncharacterized protein LOC112567516 n=1 Tax=Pomacea canaliculata TaxID=400727 RepID=UPI000D73FB31|nr:uncharacterized protein LOC112567516 [Pomacea canaliculata]
MAAEGDSTAEAVRTCHPFRLQKQDNGAASDQHLHHDSRWGGGRRRGFCRWFNVARGWGFITPDNGGQDVFVHHSVIHKAGFRSLGKGELVEFEPRLSYKGVEATFVCGIGGVKCRGSDRRPMSKEKFQNKPVVQLQQRQPQRRQSQPEVTVAVVPEVTVPVVPEVTVPVVPEMTVPVVPEMKVCVMPDMTVPVVPDMTVTVMPEVTVPAEHSKLQRLAVRQA